MDSFEGINEFVTVAKSRGFSAAAQQLGCSTSHVSGKRTEENRTPIFLVDVLFDPTF